MISDCPCCGGKPAAVEVPVNEFLPDGSGAVSPVTVQKFFITCTKCLLQTRAVKFADAPVLISHWNRRYVAPVEKVQPVHLDPANKDFPPPEA